MSNAAAVESVLFAALEKPSPAERDAFLDSACGGDAELRRQVEKLLKAHSDVGNFLQKPVVEQLAAPPEGPDATQACDAATGPKGPAMPRTEGEGSNNDEDTPLDFLQPSTRPDSLGRLGHYEMLQVLGKGGFGIVFRAFDDTLQRVVAVKVMAPQIATLSPARKRFVREARSSASVRHENVVQIYEVGEQPLPYLTMEFIPGETLQQKLDRCGPLDVPEVLQIGRQVAEGLAAAHACDLIHRDIKPANVLLEGGSHKAKITDFGLARAADDASISQSGIVAGTPMYMSPEQAQGQSLDHRADLFSLGSVLYVMVAGRPPFRANNTVAVLKRVAEDEPRAIREIIPETPQWLCDIIAKLHAKNPDERFQSAREVADLLANCEANLKAKQEVKFAACGKPAVPMASSPSGGRKWIAAAAVLLLPVIALGVTELAGVTQLFRRPQVVPSPINPDKGSADAASPEPKTPLAKTSLDTDRRVAEWALSVGGAVLVDNSPDWIQGAAALPQGRFKLATASFASDANVTDSSLANFEHCRNLTGIALHRVKVSDAGMVHFKGCDRLKILILTSTEVSDAGLTNFHDRRLVYLIIPGNRVTDAGLAGFKDCRYLTRLDLAENTISNAGLAAFKDCKQLELLNLSKTQVSDAGLGNFRGCTRLAELLLIETSVTDAGLLHFQECAVLSRILLQETGVSDKSVPQLAKFSMLTELNLQKTKVTAKGVEALHKALPRCRIEWDGGVIEPTAAVGVKTAALLFCGHGLGEV